MLERIRIKMEKRQKGKFKKNNKYLENLKKSYHHQSIEKLNRKSVKTRQLVKR